LTERWRSIALPHGQHVLPVHMIRLTEQRVIAPYKWVHPDEDR
jgi:hypothetical protein